jgi:hypothetical protein
MIQGNNKQILDYHQEIQEWHRHNSVMRIFMASKINGFYKSNENRIKTIQGIVLELLDEYFALDDKKQVVFADLVEGEKERKPIMKEGKEYQEYQTKYWELMNQPVVINW